MTSTALVCCATPGVYTRYAKAFLGTAQELFKPTETVEGVILPVPEKWNSWPAATMYRHHILLENWPDTDYVFLCDADMRFEADCGPEVLCNGITATLHPGYIGQPHSSLPYEWRRESASYVGVEGTHYYAGGFIGGANRPMKYLCREVKLILDVDLERDITPRWHDESALNRFLATYKPDLALSPAYCFPDNASGYPWLADEKRILVALDKPQELREAQAR